MFRRVPPPERDALVVLVLLALAGLLGALPGSLPAAHGALDPVALLAWLTLLAPAAGLLCTGHGLAFFPFALAVPAVWLLALVMAQARAPLTLESPLWAACGVLGLFGVGCALGKRARMPLRAAGMSLLGMLALSSACLGFGILPDGAVLARSHPELARTLLDLSPMTWIFDCAGRDWSHAQPDVYAGAGVEWFQRRPWPANLAGPLVLLVGCFLALVVSAPRPTESEG